MQSSSRDNISKFQIVRIEPKLVLMRNKDNRKIYRYVQAIDLKQVQLPQLDSIIKPIGVQSGYLYDAGVMTLASQISNCSRNGQKISFNERQIVNTVQPIFKIIQHLYRIGEFHGSISPDSIIINQFGQLKVYFPGIKQNQCFYYSDSTNKLEDDYRALALIILQLLGFNKPQKSQQTKILRTLNKCEKFSDIFIFTLLCMLQKKKRFTYEAVAKLLNFHNMETMQVLSQQEKQYFDSQIQIQKPKKSEVSKRISQKAEFTPPLIKHGDHTPKKNIQITKKYIRAQDVENKKLFEQSKKKKPTQQALKKVSNGKPQGENSNAIVSPNYKKILRDIRETKQRQDLFKMAVTIKRMRTLSKKKID